ncbi:PREDICTED: leukocyte immunoglobulin-like receptor subfamily B member 3, partial [Condylura cristata]|uniref:leukocyte immunoglobulin-like receptor subfamily B member 3 n=1 Tax=Condylura cristata TaxID=143302 RepID=UPI000642CC97
DTFHLSKEGSPAAPESLRLPAPAAPAQANFTFRAATSARGGTYRCYSSHSSSPFLLSQPSDPLELRVSGAQGLNWPSWSVLIGLSVAFLPLGALLLLLTLRGRPRCQTKHSKSGKSASRGQGDPAPEVVGLSRGDSGLEEPGRQRRWGCPLENYLAPPHEKMFVPRIWRGGGGGGGGGGARLASDFQLPTESAASTRDDRALQNSSGPAAGTQESFYAVVQDTQPKGRQWNRQAAAPAAPQEVTYAQLNYVTLQQETAALSSPEPPPGKASVYATLAAH